MSEMVEEDDVRAADLREYGRALWRHRRLVALTALVAVVAALALSFMQTASYEAQAQLILQPATSQALLGGSQPASDPARDVATETAVLESDVIRAAATKALGHVPNVSVSSDSSTSDIISVVARSSKGSVAANDANVYTKTYIAYSRDQDASALVRAAQQLQTGLYALADHIGTLPAGSAALTAALQQRDLFQQQLNQIRVAQNLNQFGRARVLSAATVPTGPVSPKPIRNVAIALILGLLLGLGLAFLREFLDDKITSREDLERATDGLPVLGQIPRVDAWRKTSDRLVTLDATHAEEPAAEAYRTLRTSLQFLGIDQALKTIQITSAESAEGKTVTAANLAVAFASADRNVALVGCDLRRPRLHELFDLPNDVGFTSVVLGEKRALEALQVVPGHPNLAVLAAGPVAPNPSELLGSPDAEGTISALASSADVVLIDSPPVLPVSDALVISGMTDATILVASVGSTTRRSIRRALELLRQVDAPVIGTVLNNADPVSKSGYSTYANSSSNGSNGDGSSRRQPPAAKRAFR